MIYYANNPGDLFTERVVRKAIAWYMHTEGTPENYYKITFIPNNARVEVFEIIPNSKMEFIEAFNILDRYNYVEANRPAIAVREKK